MRMLSEIESPLHFGSVLSYSILLAPMGAITLYFLHFFFFALILMTINHVLMKMHNGIYETDATETSCALFARKFHSLFIWMDFDFVYVSRDA